MLNCIQSLLKNQWIVEMIDEPGNYEFVHPLFFQTLYDVTPASDKARLHFSIACCMEDRFDSKPTYYAQIGRHYGHAKDCRPKAFEYFVRAGVYCMANGSLCYDEGLELLIEASMFLDSATDCSIIRSILDFNKKKLHVMRKKLIEDEEKPALSVASTPTGGRRTFFRWNFSFQKIGITPHTSPSSPSEGLHSEKTTRVGAFNADECGLTVNGTDVYLDLMQHIDDEFNIILQRMLKENKLGTSLEWQRQLKEEMSAEAGWTEETSSSEDRRDHSSSSLMHRGNVSSIKMLSTAVGARKVSLLDLIGNKASITPIRSSNSGLNLSLQHSSGHINSAKRGSQGALGSVGPGSGTGPGPGELSIDCERDRDKSITASVMDPISGQISPKESRERSTSEKSEKSNVSVRDGSYSNSKEGIQSKTPVSELETIVKSAGYRVGGLKCCVS